MVFLLQDFDLTAGIAVAVNSEFTAFMRVFLAVLPGIA
jgi:hypothetical protein